MDEQLHPATGGEIVVDAVSKRFGGLQALQGVSVQALPGQITGLIGPNGAGKSTLFNAITNVVTPDAGRVFIGGRDVTGISPRRIAHLGVGRTFQTPRSFPSLTVTENLTLAADDRAQGLLASLLHRRAAVSVKEEADHILQRIGLYEKRNDAPANLSGGELRLLEVGRHLIRSPSYLLLDEPTAGVSPDFQGRLTALLRALRDEGRTLLCVEHNMRFLIDLADVLIVLEHGEVIASGTPRDVLAHPRVIEAYLGNRGGTHAAG